MDSISRHTYGSDLIHNINVLSKNFDVLMKLSKYLELHKEEIFKDIDMNAMDAIIKDIDKGTYRGRRQIVVRPTEIIKDVASGWKYKLISVEGTTLGTFDVTEVTVEDFFYNFRDNVEKTLPKELIVTNKDCNYNSSEILVVDRDKEFFSDLFEVYFYKADEFESFNWYNSTSSLAYVIFKLSELYKLIEQLEQFNINVSEIIRLIEIGEELDGSLSADIEEYNAKIIELDIKGENLVRDFSESIENTVNTADQEIKDLAEAANRSIEKTVRDNLEAIEALAESDLSSFATKTFVEEQVGMVKTDLSNYTTKEEFDSNNETINTALSSKADKTTVNSELSKKVNNTDFTDYKGVVNRQLAEKQDKLTISGTGAVIAKSTLDSELSKKWAIQDTSGTGNIIRQSELDKKWNTQNTAGTGNIVRASVTDAISTSVATAQSKADSAHTLATTANNTAKGKWSPQTTEGTGNIIRKSVTDGLSTRITTAQNTANTAKSTADSALAKANSSSELGSYSWYPASHAIGANYVNNYGKTILVQVSCTYVSGSNTYLTAEFSVNKSPHNTAPRDSEDSRTNIQSASVKTYKDGYITMLSVYVPPGVSYKFTNNPGNNRIVSSSIYR